MRIIPWKQKAQQLRYWWKNAWIWWNHSLLHKLRLTCVVLSKHLKSLLPSLAILSCQPLAPNFSGCKIKFKIPLVRWIMSPESKASQSSPNNWKWTAAVSSATRSKHVLISYYSPAIVQKYELCSCHSWLQAQCL